MAGGYWYTSHGNGAFVTIHTPDGRSAHLQGDDAARFLDEIDRTDDRRTDADVCAEYDSVAT